MSAVHTNPSAAPATPGHTSAAPALDLQGLTKRFGALVVTDNVSLQVMPGEIHALIGPNGAGKSSLIAQVSGELAPDTGRVFFKGRRVDTLSVPRRARAGLARAYQVPRFFSSLSVEENATVPEIARTHSGFSLWSAAAKNAGLTKAAHKVLEQVGLADSAARPSALIAHGERRQLELAMGFASAPSVLLLDEPLAGLGPEDSQAMVELLRSLKGHYAMLLVEHDVEAVFSLADRISVLVSGSIIATGTADEIRADENVRTAYLGPAH